MADCAELIIAATPVFTNAGLIAKQAVVARAEFEDSEGIVAEILRQDVERVSR